jgi:hypothetical protein
MHAHRENDAPHPRVIAGLDPAIHEAEQRMKTLLIELCESHHGLPGHRRAKRRRRSAGYARQ